jgi:hypothetical protein
MKRECRGEPLGLQDPYRNDADQNTQEGEKQKEPATTIKLQSGQILLFSPPNMGWSKRRPVASLGHFRDGEPALHFRQYQRQGSGLYHLTREGVSWKLSEFDAIVRRVQDVCDVLPEMAIATWGPRDD